MGRGDLKNESIKSDVLHILKFLQGCIIWRKYRVNAQD